MAIQAVRLFRPLQLFLVVDRLLYFRSHLRPRHLAAVPPSAASSVAAPLPSSTASSAAVPSAAVSISAAPSAAAASLSFVR